jgi:hypothetical protein
MSLSLLPSVKSPFTWLHMLQSLSMTTLESTWLTFSPFVLGISPDLRVFEAVTSLGHTRVALVVSSPAILFHPERFRPSLATSFPALKQIARFGARSPVPHLGCPCPTAFTDLRVPFCTLAPFFKELMSPFLCRGTERLRA